jgi:hypothetical protein
VRRLLEGAPGAQNIRPHKPPNSADKIDKKLLAAAAAVARANGELSLEWQKARTQAAQLRLGAEAEAS